MSPDKNKVMIVDDEEYIVILIKEIFESEGYDVYTAKNGEECINLLEKGFRGIVLLDVMMPKMDGWQTVDEIVKRNLNKGNVICMLSARELQDDKKDYIKKGYVKDYLSKPFNNIELVKIVKNYSETL